MITFHGNFLRLLNSNITKIQEYASCLVYLKKGNMNIQTIYERVMYKNIRNHLCNQILCQLGLDFLFSFYKTYINCFKECLNERMTC